MLPRKLYQHLMLFLQKAGTKTFESDIFEASGYKWRLELYPNGNKEENAGNYISMYLIICHTKSIPKGWKVSIDAKFCVYDHIRDNYITFQDIDGKKTRFSNKKTKWGFSKLISLDFFTNAENGCLFRNSCVFGSEVFVVPRYAEKDQCVSLMKPIPLITMSGYTWKIKRSSHMIDDYVEYDWSDVHGVKWILLCMYCYDGPKIRPTHIMSSILRYMNLDHFRMIGEFMQNSRSGL